MSSRMMRITGGKITTFKLGHPFFDGIPWCMFPKCFCQNGMNFLQRLALQEKKKLMTARVSMLLKSRELPDMLPFSFCNKKKTCNSAHEQTPLSNHTIDSVLQHQEVCRAKDLSAPLVFSPRTVISCINITYSHSECCFILCTNAETVVTAHLFKANTVQ